MLMQSQVSDMVVYESWQKKEVENAETQSNLTQLKEIQNIPNQKKKFKIIFSLHHLIEKSKVFFQMCQVVLKALRFRSLLQLKLKPYCVTFQLLFQHNEIISFILNQLLFSVFRKIFIVFPTIFFFRKILIAYTKFLFNLFFVF